MTKATAKFIVSVSAPNSSLIDVNKILLTDMNLQFNGRLPAAVLPTTGVLPPISAGLGPGNVSVEPRDVGFPINVNSGPPTNVPYPIGEVGGGQGGGYSTGNPADARGFITLVEAPSTTTLGGQFQIKIHVRNDGKSDAKFKARVAIESLGIANEPTAGIVLRPGESGVIRKTMIMPADAQTNKLYPTVIELLKVTDAATEATVKEDEEVSTIPGPNTNVPPTGGGGQGTQCIIRNGIQYCKSNAFQQGCLIENGIVYCPTASLPQQCITRNNIQYCKAEQFVAGCIIEANTVYCPSQTPTPSPCPTGQCKNPSTGVCRPILPTEHIDPSTGLCAPNGPHPGPVPVPIPGQASITMPTEAKDGDSFTVRGAGFLHGERVDIIINLIWQSSNHQYNGKTFTLAREETADSHGTWREQLKTSEVPSGVSSIATVTAKGRQSQRIAQGQIRIT